MKTGACKRFRNAWLLDESGELSPRRRTAMRRHSDHCPACRSWAADVSRWCGVQRATVPEPPPLSPGTLAAIRIAAMRMRPQPARRLLPRPFSRPLLAAAALVLVGLLAWQFLQQAPVLRTAADEIGALAYLLQEDDEKQAPGGTEADINVPDPLVRWILRVQAGETLEYLDHRLDAAS